ncbi:MAG: FkbM family methyltransferase [Bacteroidales bacterium]
MNPKYYSQYRQDEFLDKKIFRNKRNGYFIEIGAYDGITYSNSYFFEKYRNWKGLCVEPVNERFEKLDKLRTCDKICAAIDTEEGIKTFIKVDGFGEMLSGIKDTYTQEHYLRLQNDIKNHGGKLAEINIKTITFNSLIEKYQVKRIDLLCIDTEGNELRILKSIDFNKTLIDIILVENNYKNKEIREFLVKNNFVIIGKLGSDEVYRNKKNPTFIFKIKYKIDRIKKSLSYLKNSIIND